MKMRNVIFQGAALSRALTLVAFVAGMAAHCRAEDIQLRSKWDENLTNIVLGNVDIKANPGLGLEPSVVAAWEQIATTYLLRANMYVDLRTALDTEKRRFAFKKEKATARDIFDAFLATYPIYTYSHDPKTGVIWFHPKNVNYDQILNAKVLIRRAELQVPLYSGVLQPVFSLLYANPKVRIDPTAGAPFTGNAAGPLAPFDNICVDLPAGVYCARDVLNICCLASPRIAFWAFDENGNGRVSMLVPAHLEDNNPLALVRPGAIGFWETEIGTTGNTPPTPNTIAAAVSDANPRKRWAAREYHEATRRLSHGVVSADPRIAVWEVLAWKGVFVGDGPFLKNNPLFMDKRPAVLNDLMREDTGLALVTSMELAREAKDPSVMDVVSGHKFTEAEVAEIKPDVYRIGRASKLVRDKLMQMKFDESDLSPQSLRELENTNLFILVPDQQVR